MLVEQNGIPPVPIDPSKPVTVAPAPSGVPTTVAANVAAHASRWMTVLGMLEGLLQSPVTDDVIALLPGKYQAYAAVARIIEKTVEQEVGAP